MKTLTANWFECTVKYDKLDPETGKWKKVTEKYVVDALTFTEAESRITEELKTLAPTGEFEISDISKAKYQDVILAENDENNTFHKVTIEFYSWNEKADKHQITRMSMLVEASNLREALNNVDESLRGTLVDYLSVNAISTKIMDVFTYKPQDKKQ